MVDGFTIFCEMVLLPLGSADSRFAIMQGHMTSATCGVLNSTCVDDDDGPVLIRWSSNDWVSSQPIKIRKLLTRSRVHPGEAGRHKSASKR